MGRTWQPAVLAALAVVLAACTGSGSDAAGVVSPPPPTSSVSATSAVPWAALAVSDDGPILPRALLSDAVSVAVISDGAAQPGTRFQFVVRISNGSSEPIPLDPCPSYRVQLQKVVEAGTLNCRGGPDALPAKGHIDYAMEVGINPLVKVMRDAPLVWQLGGEPTDQIAPAGRTVIAWSH